MINKALTCLTEEMNEYFLNKLKISEDKVILSGIINQDGTIAIQGENKIIVTLVNVAEAPTHKNYPPVNERPTGNSQPTPIINLTVLFSAYFSGNNYSEALHFLSCIILFFQQKNVFTSSDTAGLDDTIEAITVEMQGITTEELNNLWAALGAKYMPSVLYRISIAHF